MTDLLADFDTDTLSYDGMVHRYYRLGSGPAVVVIAEIPGITPKVIEFARRVVEAGCTVYVPSLFGVDGAGKKPSAMVKALGTVCVSREFTVFATGKSSPVVSWLRELAARAHEECGGPGVGAVGMCVTGGFALAMAVDDRMLAPVLSQPSLPVAITPGRRRTIDISPTDLDIVQARCAGARNTFPLRPDVAFRQVRPSSQSTRHRIHRCRTAGLHGKSECAGPTAFGAHRASDRRTRAAHPRRPRPGTRLLSAEAWCDHDRRLSRDSVDPVGKVSLPRRNTAFRASMCP